MDLTRLTSLGHAGACSSAEPLRQSEVGPPFSIESIDMFLKQIESQSFDLIGFEIGLTWRFPGLSCSEILELAWQEDGRRDRRRVDDRNKTNPKFPWNMVSLGK